MSRPYDSYQLLRKINISMGITAIYSSSDLSVQDLLSIMSLKDGDAQQEPPQREQSKHFLHINVSRNLPEIERWGFSFNQNTLYCIIILCSASLDRKMWRCIFRRMQMAASWKRWFPSDLFLSQYYLNFDLSCLLNQLTDTDKTKCFVWRIPASSRSTCTGTQWTNSRWPSSTSPTSSLASLSSSFSLRGFSQGSMSTS